MSKTFKQKREEKYSRETLEDYITLSREMGADEEVRAVHVIGIYFYSFDENKEIYSDMGYDIKKLEHKTIANIINKHFFLDFTEEDVKKIEEIVKMEKEILKHNKKLKKLFIKWGNDFSEANLKTIENKAVMYKELLGIIKEGNL